ncbi:hypothetical protein LG314_04890 [Agrococcus terreus]|uniref:hypothetical protein n=1 Tax=Agrococcus terreus TaxID=574649 RepID=UPI00384FEFC5
MRGARSAILVAAALLAAVTQAGCAGSEALVALDEPGAVVCAPADSDGRAVFGISAIQNVSGSEVEASDAELFGADGMELIGLELRAPDDPDASIVGGDYDRYGPVAIALPQSLAEAESYVTLIGVHVEPGAGGSADGMSLSFRGSDGAGRVETRIRMEVVPSGEVCEMGG